MNTRKYNIMTYTFGRQVVLVQISYGVVQREYLDGREPAEQEHRVNGYRREHAERQFVNVPLVNTADRENAKDRRER